MDRTSRRGWALAFRAWRTVVCLVVALVAASCDRPKPKPLRFGLSDWPGHAPFYGAAKLGYFSASQVEIKSFSSSFDRNRAFAEGRLDVLAATLFDALRIADGGTPLKIILLCDYSSGGDGIVARKEIGSVAELRGKRVAAEVAALTHFVLLSALERAGLGETDVEIVNLTVPEGADAFARGKVDAATLWDPHLSRQASLQGAHKLFTSKEIHGEVIDLLVVHKALADERPEDVASIVQGWEKALSAWRARPAELEAVMAKETNRTPESLRVDFTGMELFDIERNRALFDPSAPGQSVWRSYEATARFMMHHRLIKGPPPPAQELLDPRFLGQAQSK